MQKPSEYKAPFRVDIDDLFKVDEQGPETDYVMGHFEDLHEAVETARELTLASAEQFESVDLWKELGENALVFDADGRVVWNGVEMLSGDLNPRDE